MGTRYMVGTLRTFLCVVTMTPWFYKHYTTLKHIFFSLESFNVMMTHTHLFLVR